MDRSTLVRTGIAGAVAALGLTAGGVAIVSAEPGTAETTGIAHPGGPPGDRGHAVEVIAEELGLEEDVVREALSTVRDELRPADGDADTPPEEPTEAERAARRAAFAAALAEELQVSETEVAAALDVLQAEAEEERTERRAEARERLVERLDAAVEDGTLTAADMASVLKAFDAQLLGGFGRGDRGPAGSPSTT